jgi:hypothetical protein
MRRDFAEQQLVKQKRFTQESHLHAEGAFEGQTTFREAFREHEQQRKRKKKMPKDQLSLSHDAPFQAETTSRRDFTEKPLEQQIALRHSTDGVAVKGEEKGDVHNEIQDFLQQQRFQDSKDVHSKLTNFLMDKQSQWQAEKKRRASWKKGQENMTIHEEPESDLTPRKVWGAVESNLQEEKVVDPRQPWSVGVVPQPPASKPAQRRASQDAAPASAPPSPVKTRDPRMGRESATSSADIRSPRAGANTTTMNSNYNPFTKYEVLPSLDLSGLQSSAPTPQPPTGHKPAAYTVLPTIPADTAAKPGGAQVRQRLGSLN